MAGATWAAASTAAAMSSAPATASARRATFAASGTAAASAPATPRRRSDSSGIAGCKAKPGPPRGHARLIMRAARARAKSPVAKDSFREVDMMKLVLTTAFFVAGVPIFASDAGADPYKWCALYNAGRGGGAQNCYFVTYAQC